MLLSAYSGQEKRHRLQMSSGLGWKALFYFTPKPLSASVSLSADNTKITLRKVSGDQTREDTHADLVLHNPENLILHY